MDKPKTLSEQLTKLADWIEFLGDEWRRRHQYAIAEDCYERAEAVRALAERVKGCVVVRPQCRTGTWMHPDKTLAWFDDDTKYASAFGDNDADAIANLQALLDEQRG